MANNELYQLNEINDIALQGLLKGQELVLINNENIHRINLSGIQLNRIIIKNCKNLKTVEIRDQENLIVEFDSCHNVISLVLANCKVSTLTINYSAIKKIELLYLEISQYLHLDKLTNERLEIRQSKNHQYDLIRNITLTNCNLDSVYIWNIKSDQIYFSESDFKYILLNNITTETIDFVNISFILDKRPISGINLLKVNCLSYFNFQILDHIKSSKVKFLFEDVKLFGESRFILKNSVANDSEYTLSLSKVSALGGIEILKENWIKKIYGEFTLFPNDEGNIIVDEVHFIKLTLKGFNVKASLNTLNSNIEHLKFENFNNKGVVKIINSDVFDTFDVVNSDLDNVVIRPLIVKNLKLSQGSFLGGLKVDGSNALSLDNTELLPENKQEFYRQLKQAAKNSNNKFLELEYKAKEMAHYKPISSGDKVSHWVNSLSDHGTNWVKPLCYIIYWNITIWLFLMPNLYSDYFTGNKSHEMTLFGSFIDLLFGLFVLLNPLSRLNDFNSFLVYSAHLNIIVPVLFFTSKIINGILIYQMISAFRKWVGKD